MYVCVYIYIYMDSRNQRVAHHSRARFPAQPPSDEVVAIILSTVSSTPQRVILDAVDEVSASLPETPIMVGGVWPELPDNVLSINGFPSMLEQLELLSAS